MGNSRFKHRSFPRVKSRRAPGFDRLDRPALDPARDEAEALGLGDCPTGSGKSSAWIRTDDAPVSDGTSVVPSVERIPDSRRLRLRTFYGLPS